MLRTGFIFLHIHLSLVCYHNLFPCLISYFPPLFWLTKQPPPPLRKASCSNPRPIFSNCMRNDFTLVRRCLTSFRKKLYTTNISNHAPHPRTNPVIPDPILTPAKEYRTGLHYTAAHYFWKSKLVVIPRNFPTFFIVGLSLGHGLISPSIWLLDR